MPSSSIRTHSYGGWQVTSMTSRARSVIADEANDIYVSAVSASESRDKGDQIRTIGGGKEHPGSSPRLTSGLGLASDRRARTTWVTFTAAAHSPSIRSALAAVSSAMKFPRYAGLASVNTTITICRPDATCRTMPASA
jgi:hypothetical protein